VTRRPLNVDDVIQRTACDWPAQVTHCYDDDDRDWLMSRMSEAISSANLVKHCSPATARSSRNICLFNAIYKCRRLLRGRHMRCSRGGDPSFQSGACGPLFGSATGTLLRLVRRWRILFIAAALFCRRCHSLLDRVHRDTIIVERFFRSRSPPGGDLACCAYSKLAATLLERFAVRPAPKIYGRTPPASRGNAKLRGHNYFSGSA
jgi:hypothetical protein